MSLFPACSIVERDAISCCSADGDGYEAKHDDDHHRFLGGGGGDAHAYCEDPGLYPAPGNISTCDDHKWHLIHSSEEVLFGITIFILSTFMVQLNIEMICLTPCVFFRQFFYLFDYLIIATSLTLELTFHFMHNDKVTSVIGLLVIARVWRFVRIGHGIVSVTTEVNNERFMKLLAYRTTRRDSRKRAEILSHATL